MFKKVLLAVALLIGLVLAYASSLPDSFTIERSATIQATPERIFAHVDDFHYWTSWSPWEGRDPNMKRTYSGAPRGVGAIYEWEGNSEVGKGRMEIIELVPPTKIKIRLDFLAPFEAHNTAEFTFAAGAPDTIVTWSMSGPSPFLSKLMSLVFDMDSMVGKDFEAGLSNLKSLTEG